MRQEKGRKTQRRRPTRRLLRALEWNLARTTCKTRAKKQLQILPTQTRPCVGEVSARYKESHPVRHLYELIASSSNLILFAISSCCPLSFPTAAARSASVFASCSLSVASTV